MQFKLKDKVTLNPKSEYANFTGDLSNPLNMIGEIIEVDNKIGKMYDLPIMVKWKNGKTNGYNQKDLLIVNTTIMSTTKQLMQDLVENAASDLAKANNTFTTLELKTKLRIEHSEFVWNQGTVSSIMMDLATSNKFTFVNNGTYRIYSTPVASLPARQVKLSSKAKQTAKISRVKALEMMKNNKGRFFTVTFIKKDGTTRVLNGIYVKDQIPSQLGYVLVKDAKLMKTKAKEQIRNVNLQTLATIKIAGNTYQVK